MPDFTYGETSAGISRRTLIGAAWSVPVIAVATAVPAAAASTAAQLSISFAPATVDMIAFDGDEREGTSILTIRNESSTAFTDPIVVFSVLEAPFWLNAIEQVTTDWDFHYEAPDIYGVSYTGGIPAGGSVTSGRLFFRGAAPAGATQTIVLSVLGMPSVLATIQLAAV